MSIVKKPLLTEKSVKGNSAKVPVFGFIVDIDATKAQIASEISRIYTVDVTDIRTLIARGKRHTRQTKRGVSHGKASNFKKAFVTLKDGQTIDLYSNF
jgi:large subunit ribosomal protein L23